MASIGGNDRPKFFIYTKDGVKVDEILLDLCDEDGLTEEYEIKATEHNLYNYSTEIDYEGYHIYFSLSYNRYSNNENTLKIGKLLQHILTNKKIELMPRSDLNLVKYEVIYLIDKNIEKGVLKGGNKSIGNRLITLTFRTKHLQRNINWYDPNNLYVAIDFNDFAKI
jgi:hypothetical protein